MLSLVTHCSFLFAFNGVRESSISASAYAVTQSTFEAMFMRSRNKFGMT